MKLAHKSEDAGTKLEMNQDTSKKLRGLLQAGLAGIPNTDYLTGKSRLSKTDRPSVIPHFADWQMFTGESARLKSNNSTGPSSDEPNQCRKGEGGILQFATCKRSKVLTKLAANF